MGGLRLGLPTQGLLQGLHGRTNGASVALGAGGFQILGGFQHRLVVRGQCRRRLLALLCFALEGIVDGLAEGVPQFLFLTAVQGHAL